jgi:hypothetical protein
MDMEMDAPQNTKRIILVARFSAMSRIAASSKWPKICDAPM